MKKTMILSALTVSAAALVVAAPALAATIVDAQPTNGTVKFVEDDGTGEIIEPDPEEGIDEIITLPPTEGGSGSGALRIQFVPNFRFGTQTGIVAAAIERPAQLLTTMKADGVTAHGEIAPFVQITDGRGLDDAESHWELSAVATKFEAPGHDLGESHITLEGSTLTTSQDDTVKANEMAEGHTPGVAISTESTAATTILKTKDGESSNGYQVSNVFHNGYKKGMSYPAIPGIPENSTNGVKFHKSKDVAPRKNLTYTSTITWTLTSGK